MTRERVLLARIDKLFDETEQYYVPDVSAIDVRMSYPTRRKYGTLDEMRKAIRALASTRQEGGVTDEMVEAAHHAFWRASPRLAEEGGTKPAIREALEAAARASGEKGGAR